jgi:uncharacterized protein
MMTRRRGGMGCGGGLGLVILAVLLLQLLGGGGAYGGVDSPFDPYPGGATPGSTRTVPGAPDPGVQSEQTDFVRFVAADLQTFWEQEMSRAGQDYDPTQVVVFRRAVRSGCGVASSDTGPFYCPADRRVYLDLSFFRELEQRFRAPGDFAQAYVIAHEVGHHVQTLTGVTQQVNAAAQGDREIANELSIRQELMADCLAGVWAHSTYERGLLEEGDLEEGLNAAAAVGDDRIQRETTGRIQPESWTHGSSAARRRWFTAGFRGGDASVCDTFAEGADIA